MALAKDRNTPSRSGDLINVPVAAATIIYQGALVALNAAVAVPGATALNRRTLGRASERVDNSAGADGDLSVEIEQGVFRFANSSAADEITIADLGQTCFVVDDETVARTDGTNTRSPAGQVFDVDANGVWVFCGVKAPV